MRRVRAEVEAEEGQRRDSTDTRQAAAVEQKSLKDSVTAEFAAFLAEHDLEAVTSVFVEHGQ